MKKLPVIPDCPKCELFEQGISVFSGCAVSTLEKNFPDKKFYLFKKGDYLFKEGQTVFGVYCINSGKVKTYKTEEDERKVVVQSFGNGSLVGLNSIEEPNYVNSAIAIDLTLACFFPISELKDLKKVLPSIKKKV